MEATVPLGPKLCDLDVALRDSFLHPSEFLTRQASVSRFHRPLFDCPDATISSRSSSSYRLFLLELCKPACQSQIIGTRDAVYSFS